MIGGLDAGWIGEVHPLLCREWDLYGAAAFEIGLAELAAASPFGHETYEDVTTYPAVYIWNQNRAPGADGMSAAGLHYSNLTPAWDPIMLPPLVIPPVKNKPPVK